MNDSDLQNGSTADPNALSLSDLLHPEHTEQNLTTSEVKTHSTEHHTHESGHHHVHSQESLKRLVNRLSRIEGHIRGIKTMVQESRACPDVLVQIAAVRGALDRVARLILDEHLDECVGRAAQDGDIEEELQALKSALDRFLPYRTNPVLSVIR